MSAKTKLLLRKMLVAFIVGFVGALVTTLDGLSKEPELHWDRGLIVSVIVGGLAAGARAVLAWSPINLVPSDAQHSLGQKGG